MKKVTHKPLLNILKDSELRENSSEYIFTEIYNNNMWENDESVSGPGSTLEYTKNLRKELILLFNEFNIKSVFDAPCGDFNWMQHVIKNTDISYIGGDIVPELIEKLNFQYKKEKNLSFIHIDLIKDKLPASDLMICRDCLFHMPFYETKQILKNFIDSNSSYLLTTTHINENNFSNIDIKMGDFRFIDLFLPPYCFLRDTKFEIDDWLEPFPKKKMCLWHRKQIIEAVNNFNIK